LPQVDGDHGASNSYLAKMMSQFRDTIAVEISIEQLLLDTCA
jgi:hypothetical protein